MPENPYRAPTREELDRAVEQAKHGNFEPLLGFYVVTPDWSRAIDESGRYFSFPIPFDAKAVRESARVRPDLANQVRRTASGHTFSRGGAMRMPAKWGSGHE
ncbi:hypothetical protein [Gluconobacter cerinus]|uniref:hypothetical protein n=1 Tax=Gluconobacter cerinus TaxID=38307 RepID=UPI001B8B3413|nr:hypothetical protein [Gluconobacter cerinus]MBS1067271.1 hypothetical protein [Gluconobacter cerinus]